MVERSWRAADRLTNGLCSEWMTGEEPFTGVALERPPVDW